MSRVIVGLLLSTFLYSPFIRAQSNDSAIRDVGDKCLAAFQRDPSVSTMLPPRAFCLCVAQQVTSSLDDRKSATDRAGNFCLQMMNSPKTFGDGIARGQNESCLRDREILLYYPKTYREFCSCLGSSFADEITSNRPLSTSTSISLKLTLEESRERAVQRCVKTIPR